MLSWFESNLTPAHQQQLYNCPAALLRERRKYGGTDRNSSKNKKDHRAKTNIRLQSRSSSRLSRGELRLLSNFVNKPRWSKITPKHLASLHCSISVIANLREPPLESEVGDHVQQGQHSSPRAEMPAACDLQSQILQNSEIGDFL